MSEQLSFESIENQKNTWSKGLIGHEGIGAYGAEWGNIDSTAAKNMRGDVLGDYHYIQHHYLIPNIKDKTVVDLGCLDGKWLVPMSRYAKKIIAVDILSDGLDRIKRWPGYNPEQIEFYLTKGYELEGIEDGSIDFIFSIDVFPRTEIAVFNRYLAEFKRVLSN